MNLRDLKSADRRIVTGLAISLGSFVLLAVGLYFVLTAALDDPVRLPDQGSIQDIVDGNGGVAAGSGATGATPLPVGPHPTRMAIPRILIDAPVEAMGFEEGTDTPAVPKRADEVAWYTFTPSPGLGTNAVFSGHVDWQTPAGSPIPGVFYRLRELEIGDRITLTLEDGQVLEYRVTGNVAAKYDDQNVVRSMGATSKDVITLITCGGSWISDNRRENGGNYSHRIIVRAERVAPAAAAQAAAR
jgi:LPXTG-site transpeptidase (sortase) family protein